MFFEKNITGFYQEKAVKLNEGSSNREYCVMEINTGEEGIKEFLFTLGCYPGEKITIISQIASSYIINIKDARYSIDGNLAGAIIVKDSRLEYQRDCCDRAI